MQLAVPLPPCSRTPNQEALHGVGTHRQSQTFGGYSLPRRTTTKIWLPSAEAGREWEAMGGLSGGGRRRRRAAQELHKSGMRVGRFLHSSRSPS